MADDQSFNPAADDDNNVGGANGGMPNEGQDQGAESAPDQGAGGAPDAGEGAGAADVPATGGGDENGAGDASV